jgi:hypothetical protein
MTCTNVSPRCSLWAIASVNESELPPEGSTTPRTARLRNGASSCRPGTMHASNTSRLMNDSMSRRNSIVPSRPYSDAAAVGAVSNARSTSKRRHRRAQDERRLVDSLLPQRQALRGEFSLGHEEQSDHAAPTARRCDRQRRAGNASAAITQHRGASNHAALLPFFGGRRMSTITTADIRAFIAHRQAPVQHDDGTETPGASHAEINRELAVIRRLPPGSSGREVVARATHSDAAGKQCAQRFLRTRSV